MIYIINEIKLKYYQWNNYLLTINFQLKTVQFSKLTKFTKVNFSINFHNFDFDVFSAFSTFPSLHSELSELIGTNAEKRLRTGNYDWFRLVFSSFFFRINDLFTFCFSLIFFK